MKDTYYFSHDYNTRTDVKIKRIIAKHGMLGYGVFWAIIEDLYNNANALPTDYESIAFDLRTNEMIVKSIVNDFDLFIIDGELFGSLSVQRRLDERNERSTKARESANKRWNKLESNANALPLQSEPNAIKESKGEEIKPKKEVKNKYGEFGNVFLTETEYNSSQEKYKHLLPKMIKKLDEYIASKGTKYKSHYATFSSWVHDSVIEDMKKNTHSSAQNNHGIPVN